MKEALRVAIAVLILIITGISASVFSAKKGLIPLVITFAGIAALIVIGNVGV